MGMMRILQISDTHSRHRKLKRLPAADVIVHCGDFADNIYSNGAVLDDVMNMRYEPRVLIV